MRDLPRRVGGHSELRGKGKACGLRRYWEVRRDEGMRLKVWHQEAREGG